MAKYKIGDKVRVRSDLQPYEEYGGISLMPHMGRRCEEEVTISYVDEEDDTYHIAEEGDGGFWWSGEMFEPIKATRFKIGDRVRVLDGSHIVDYTGNWNPDMQRFVGNTYIIAQVCNSYPNRTAYFLEGQPYVFDERGIEPAPASKCRSVAYPKQTKEDKSMIFRVIDGERVDKTCNKKVQTKITEVRVGELEGVARCDADEYNERDGVLNAIANAVCGNFDREYGKFLAKKKREYEASCKCAICGHTADTPDDARACEAAHEARKKAKREAWLEKREAAKRLRELEREGRIEEYMKQIAKKGRK